jgi:hypothetical protein
MQKRSSVYRANNLGYTGRMMGCAEEPQLPITIQFGTPGWSSFALLIVASSFGTPSDAADRLTENDFLNYLTQSICLDALGRPAPGTPLDAGCQAKRSQTTGDLTYYRKHDWPNVNDLARDRSGYQASDSVVGERGGRSWILQTFDFGNPPRIFGKFDAGQGDGGQVVALTDGWASAIMTEDGGAGVQWFIGPGCLTAPKSDAGLVSWIFFGGLMRPGDWQSVVARLNRDTSRTACPTHFNTAYTRYRTDLIDTEFRVVGPSKDVQIISRKLDMIVSEHYGGDDIAHADHLERFYFGRDFGLLRWERWENFAISRQPDAGRMADLIAGSGRCRAARYSEPPGSRWRMIDCRSWTMLVEQQANWSADMYRWPALDALGPAAKRRN